MHTLVNYTGNNQFYTGRSCSSGNPGLKLSIGSHVDIFCPPRKRSRVSGPYLVESLEKTQKKSIENLPDECLFEILRRLPGDQERGSSACVSKRWLNLLSTIKNSEICKNSINCASDEDLTRCLEGKKANDIRLAAISVATCTRGGISKLLIRGGGVTNHGLTIVSHTSPSLKSLSLWKVNTLQDEGLVNLAKECPNLERIDLSDCQNLTDKGIIGIAENCPNLSFISIKSCKSIGNEGLKYIGKFCKKLQSITIIDCPLIGDQGVANLMSNASTLETIKLEGLNITDYSLVIIGHFGLTLTTVILNGLQKVSERGFWGMGNARGLKGLTRLTINMCNGVTDTSLEALGKGCPNLKHVCLRRCLFVSDNGLVSLTNVSKSLEFLKLEECNRVSQIGILHAISVSNLKTLCLIKCLGIRDYNYKLSVMLSPCETLQSLTIRNCPGFGNSSLALIGKLFPNLYQLDLTDLNGVTDIAIMSLIENCEAGLVKVNLTNCFNISDKAVSALAELHGGSIEILNLDGCRNVTDKSLASIAENCLILNDLDVSKCSISDLGIGILSKGVQLDLQILSLSGCVKITNKSVPSLKKLGKTLKGLNLQHCDGMSSNVVKRLAENLWKCDILY